MRIIHTSDMHIGAPFGARLSADKIRLRKSELIDNFRRMAKEGRDIGAEAMIIAGDLFDSERVPLSTCRQIIAVIESFGEISFIYLPGNHEKSAFVECGLAMPKNLMIFTNSDTCFVFGDISVYGLTDAERSAIIGLAPDPKRRNILVMHGALTDGKSSGGDVIGIDDLKERGFDYIALGHYHSYEAKEIDKRCKAVYCGTPEGRGFDECGEKGYVVLDIDESSVSHSFKKFSRRTVRRIEVNAEGVLDRHTLEEKAAEALSSVPRDDTVRLAFVGKRSPELVIDTSKLCARWQSSFFYFEAVDETSIKVDPNEYAFDKSLKGEFIRLVSGRDDLSDEEKGQIILCGINALMGEFYEV